MARRNAIVGATSEAWLLVVVTLQGQHQALRMRLWRGLKGLGAAVMRDGVYLLPNRPQFVAAVQSQADEVIASGGSAQVLTLDARTAAQDTEFRSLFDRSADYEKLLPEMQALSRSIARLDARELQSRLDQLRRDYEAIALQDFFPGPLSEPARIAWEDLTQRVQALLAPDEPHAQRGRIPVCVISQYRGRTWVTRERPWADRLGSAWLIKRFIDKRASFKWVKSTSRLPKRSIGFDFDGAQFTHVGNRVTYEVLLASFGLEADAALQRIGAVIHYLDVGGVPPPEAAGVEALLRGACAAMLDDDSLVLHTSRLFDDLYLHFSSLASDVNE